jgi:hypothetical protein
MGGGGGSVSNGFHDHVILLKGREQDAGEILYSLVRWCFFDESGKQ